LIIFSIYSCITIGPIATFWGLIGVGIVYIFVTYSSNREKVCLKCKKLVPREASYCPVCGSDYVYTRGQIKKYKQQAIEEKEQLNIEKCDPEKIIKWLPEKLEQIRKSVYYCKNCDTVNGMKYSFCMKCGSKPVELPLEKIDRKLYLIKRREIDVLLKDIGSIIAIYREIIAVVLSLMDRIREENAELIASKIQSYKNLRNDINSIRAAIKGWGGKIIEFQELEKELNTIQEKLTDIIERLASIQYKK